VDAAAKERRRERLALYARVVGQAVTPEWKGQVDRLEELLKVLIDVTPHDLRVLATVTKKLEGRSPVEAPNRVDFRVDDIREMLPDLSGEGVKAYLIRLERLGLFVGVALGGAVSSEQGAYVATHIFTEFEAVLDSLMRQ